MAKQKEIKLAAIHPSAGLKVKFQQELEALIDEMQNSLVYWISAAYKRHGPLPEDEPNQPPNRLITGTNGSVVAQDASSAALLSAIMARLTRKWTKKFNEAAKPLADYYALASAKRTDAALKAALKKAGVTVEFKVTKEIQTIITASVNENVQSIKSIASEHLTDVAQIVQRSVQQGRDLGGLKTELVKRYGITKRRAELIAGTSNNQASAMIERQRAKELGIEEATWVHSNAGKHPRSEHVHWHGERYNVQTGMWSKVSKKWVWPSTDFNCRCSSRLTMKTQVVISESTKKRMK